MTSHTLSTKNQGIIYSSLMSDTCYNVNTAINEPCSGSIAIEWTLTSISSPYWIDPGSIYSFTVLTGNFALT